MPFLMMLQRGVGNEEEVLAVQSSPLSLAPRWPDAHFFPRSWLGSRGHASVPIAARD